MINIPKTRYGGKRPIGQPKCDWCNTPLTIETKFRPEGISLLPAPICIKCAKKHKDDIYG